MKFRSKKFNLALPIISLLMAASCGGGSDTAGIGGSGFISSGSVTGFGSVFVNGVKFETTASTFDVEDVDGSQDDLRVGMVVQVQGTINADGVSGTATHIQYADDLQGQISGVSENPDMTEKFLTILNKKVVISNTDTAFEGTSYDLIAEDDVVEVSGYYDQIGELRASYIEFKTASLSDVEVKGEIAELSGTNFKVLGINVDTATASASIDLPNGLQIGVLVEVKGTYNNSTNTIIATQVEAEDNELSENDEVEVEGLITSYVDDSEFDINGYPVNASNAVFTPTGLVLEVGIKVEAEGSVSNGILNASEIELRGGSAEISAEVVDVTDLANNRFSVLLVAGEPPITVQLSASTRVEDELGDNDNPLSIVLNNGDFVEVRGFETDTSTIEATQVKRESEVKETQLQGVVSAKVDDVSITVLGVVFPVNASTEYEAENDVAFATSAEFFNALIPGQTVVNIVDMLPGEGNAIGVADEVEIED